jgi:hypothetical protein
MKTLLKILITAIIILTIPISIYYGLRFKNTHFTLEYINNKHVITLPNQTWFEIGGPTDTLDNEKIFETDSVTLETTGIDFGLQYPTYTTTTENKFAKRTTTATRVGDTVTITQNLEIKKEGTSTYTTPIFFSQYGEFNKNTYIHEGCEVKISSETGAIQTDRQNATTTISYAVEDNIKDTITFDISCYEK